MSCSPATALGIPEPPDDTSEWIRALAKDPEGESVPGYRNGDFLELHRRPPTPAGAVYREEVVYGNVGDRVLTLRLYARACPGERRPAAVFFHGGGWVSGDPSMHMRHAHGLAARGFVTALVSYRLYPEARWPEPLHDAKCAVRWLRAHADLIGADPDWIAVSGCSAGGHLAALVGLTPGQFEGDGGHSEVSSAAQAMVLWYPVVDLARVTLPDENRVIVEEFLEGPLDRQAPAASPLRMVSQSPPPTLLLTGSDDRATTVETIEEFRAALVAAGGIAELVVYPGRGHAFNLLPGDWTESFEAAAGFLARHATPHPGGLSA